MESLPNELLTSIFEHLAPTFSTSIEEAPKATATLANVSQTSRRLYQLVQPLLYRTVIFERFVRGRHLNKDEAGSSLVPISGLDVLRQHPHLGRYIHYIRAEEFSIFKLRMLPHSHEQLVERMNDASLQPVATYIQSVLNDLEIQHHKTANELWLYRETALLEVLAMAPNLKACDLSLGRVFDSPVSRYFEVQAERDDVECEHNIGRVRHIHVRYDQHVQAPHCLSQPNIRPLLFLPRLESITLDFRCGWDHVNNSNTSLFSKYGLRPDLQHFKIMSPPLPKIGPISDILSCFPNLTTLALHTPLQFASNGDNYTPMGDALRSQGRKLRCFELASSYEKYELMRNLGGIGSLRDHLPDLQQLRIAFPRLTGWNEQMGLREGNRTLHIAGHLPATLRYFWTAMGNGGRDKELEEHTLALEEMFADAADGMLPDLEWVLVQSALMERKWNCLPRGWEVDWFYQRHKRVGFYLFTKKDGASLGSAEAPPDWNVWPVTEFAKKREDRGRCVCQ